MARRADDPAHLRPLRGRCRASAYTAEEYIADAHATGLHAVRLRAGQLDAGGLASTKSSGCTSSTSAPAGRTRSSAPRTCSSPNAIETLAGAGRGLAADARHRLQLHWHDNPRVPLRLGPDRASRPVRSTRTSRGCPSSGWVFELQVFPNQLAYAARAGGGAPRPDVRARSTPACRSRASRGARRCAQLSDHPNVCVKLSGQGTFVHRVDPELIADVTRAVLDTFGSERAMFGSNFPIESLWTDFSSLIGAWLGVLAEYPDRGARRRPRPDRTPRLQARREEDPGMTRPVQHTAAAVAGWLREGRRVVAGLLVEVEGSSPLDVGASHVHRRPGRDRGLDHRRLRRGRGRRGGDGDARRATARRSWSPTGSRDELAGTVGLMCGGIVHIFIHELKAEHREAVLRDLEATIDAPPRRAGHADRRRARGRASSSSTPRGADRHRSAAASCWTRTPRARPAACSTEGRSTHARLRHRRRVARHRPARLRLDPGRAAADGRLRRDRLLLRARAAGQGPRLPGDDRRPALARSSRRGASPPPPRPRSAGPTRSSTASSSARATRC